MSNSGDFLFGEHRNVQLLQLPYGQNEEFSMLFAKPRHPSQVWNYNADPLNFVNITQLSNEVDETLMKEWLQTLLRSGKREADIYVPKFTLKKGFNMIKKLKALGITDLFSDDADLSQIAGKKDLYVSSAEHQVVVEADEAGTAAAGATG